MKLSFFIPGIDFAGMSQLVGYPTQYPSVSMVDWNTGALNARAVTLKLLIENFGNGDQLVETVISGQGIWGAAFVNKGGEKKLLLINKTYDIVRVQLDQLPKSTTFIDIKTSAELKTEKLITKTIPLNGFAVHVIKF